MSNKDIFKELYSKYLNKEKNYNKILENIERDKKDMYKYLKWAFVPMSLIIALCGVIIFNGNNNSLLLDEVPNESCINNKLNNVILNINNVSEGKGVAKIDAQVREIDSYDIISNNEVLSNLKVPSDFNTENTNAIFIKSDKEASEYDYLMQYEKIYKNSSNDRNIVINYSEKNKLMRDYHFEEGKSSKINNYDIVIYKYENSYMTEFNYKNLNIDIETSNIREVELVELLQSIIK